MFSKLNFQYCSYISYKKTFDLDLKLKSMNKLLTDFEKIIKDYQKKSLL